MATNRGAMVPWLPFAVDLVGVQSTCTSYAFPTAHTPVLSPLRSSSTPVSIPALWPSVMRKNAGEVVSLSFRCVDGRPSFTLSSFPTIWTVEMKVCFGGVAEESRWRRMAVVWLVWFGLGVFPELVPVLYVFLSGIGSSLVIVVTVVWVFFVVAIPLFLINSIDLLPVHRNLFDKGSCNRDPSPVQGGTLVIRWAGFP